ncbi:hypothetical protein BABINDRAFT_159670 [Babjeviella inositovora NRRL Y-12698]|uniref:AMP-dependent synthetase/ligase domain-containing protein n=1 Tax=Babjeviella inositovora NRRL Y-12698 TaxID=984486 RepID=A0A1E3R1I9_9ASCO|nr:uncharacterized protein BABINDRAFT_159670 [Babjeviella inositovora NRRL Y-12698]ODQ83232.1 hypothetical protein BABINDRAFT_159670 [Babjeviella inositovora NRRL Y-12698]
MSDIMYPTTYPPGINANSHLHDNFIELAPFERRQFNGLFEMPGTASEKGSPVFRSKICAITEDNNMVTSLHPKLSSIHECFQYMIRLHAKKRCFATRDSPDSDYIYRTYEEVGEARDRFGSGLVNLIRNIMGIDDHQYRLDDKDDFVLTTLLPNCYEWFIADLGCISYSISNSALYGTLSQFDAAYILNLTKSPVIILSKDKILSTMTIIHEYKLSSIKVLIVTDYASAGDIPLSQRQLAEDLSIKCFTFAEISQMGAKHPLDHLAPIPSGIYTISFTSGTVGNPKGVVLTHQSACASLATLVTIFTTSSSKKRHAPGLEYSVLCILPLAHVYQRLVCVFELFMGATIYLPTISKDVKQILADLVAVRPSHLVGVPRIFNRIDAGITTKIQSLGWMTKYLYKKTLDYKKEKFKEGQPMTNHWLYDRNFTQKIRTSLGLDNVQLLVTGSSNMLPETIRRLRSLLNADFIQGYGLTESFACVTIPFGEDEYLPVSSGYISCTTELKLRDKADIDFTWAKNRSGEIMIRGPQISKEYYRDPIRTQEAYDAEGWFFTGDIGRVDKSGRLEIVDRVKNITTLHGGYSLSPEKVENVYLQFNPGLVSQMYVTGSSTHSFLVGILVLDEQECLELLKRSNQPKLKKVAYMNETNMKELNDNLELRKYILSEINSRVSDSKLLNKYEKVGNIHLFFNNGGRYAKSRSVNYGFTDENGLLTPTMKTRRYDARRFFDVELKNLYEQGTICNGIVYNKV